MDEIAGDTAVIGPAGAGRMLGPYKVVSEIGRGGMGVVFKAHDPVLDRDAAVKILSPHLASDESFVKRFVREARAVAGLDHPGIAQVYQAGWEGGVLYIAMIC
ncbi:MAG TPA: hypothetical protein ENN09_07165 [Planctomycetes bacterium]|nr:hypothetical protein [Planctomycetota bacterium]